MQPTPAVLVPPPPCHGLLVTAACRCQVVERKPGTAARQTSVDAGTVAVAPATQPAPASVPAPVVASAQSGAPAPAVTQTSSSSALSGPAPAAAGPSTSSAGAQPAMKAKPESASAATTPRPSATAPAAAEKASATTMQRSLLRPGADLFVREPASLQSPAPKPARVIKLRKNRRHIYLTDDDFSDAWCVLVAAQLPACPSACVPRPAPDSRSVP
jgi:hypothetical protein